MHSHYTLQRVRECPLKSVPSRGGSGVQTLETHLTHGASGPHDPPTKRLMIGSSVYAGHTSILFFLIS